MAENGRDFPTCRHNKVVAKQVFRGGPWRSMAATFCMAIGGGEMVMAKIVEWIEISNYKWKR